MRAKYQPTDMSEICSRYRALLLDDVVPFWFRHGIDWQHGGVLSCMTDEGAVESGDKFIWSQARSVWTFSALYNRIEPRPEFLKAAENSVRFILSHGRDARGRWVYHTTREGAVIEGATSIYTDFFAIYGLSEYYRAAHDENALAVARETYEMVRRRIEEPDFHETAPYPMPPGSRCHGISMMMTEVTNELAQTTGDAALNAPLRDSISHIMNSFVRPRRRVLLEFISRDYQHEIPAPAGTLVIPGHTIESMWMVIHAARRLGEDELVRRAADVVRWHLELGWDPEWGGLFLSRDTEGGQTYFPHSEKKLWWPHVEAMYATLLAHQLTGESWWLEWYKRVADWAWSHFPAPGGEWRQRLTREGEPSSEVIALPVKDPFHLPRAAILIAQLSEIA